MDGEDEEERLWLSRTLEMFLVLLYASCKGTWSLANPAATPPVKRNLMHLAWHNASTASSDVKGLLIITTTAKASRVAMSSGIKSIGASFTRSRDGRLLLLTGDGDDHGVEEDVNDCDGTDMNVDVDEGNDDDER